MDITDNSCYVPFSFFFSPGKNSKRRTVGIKIHIRCFNASETFNRGTVQHKFIVQNFINLFCRNSHIFDHTVYVNKLKTNKFYVVFVNQLFYLFFRELFSLFRNVVNHLFSFFIHRSFYKFNYDIIYALVQQFFVFGGY